VQGRRFPRIQLIETHRVCDAKLPARFKEEGYIQFDGILTDQRGRPAFYIVSNDNDAFSKNTPSQVAIIPAPEIVHVFEPSRASQPRGLTLFHACLSDLHDLDDLQRYEMLSSKDASSRANVVKTANGELPDDGSVIGRTAQVVGDDGQIEERIVYYNTAFGAKTVVLKHGDDWQQSEALRPTSAQQEFWKILERKICRGTGVSYAALTDYEGNWGGAALRGAIAADNRFYDVRTQTLCTAFQIIWEHVIGSQVKPGGDLAKEAPADWRNITCQSPRRSTVDIGRESKAILEELEAGVRTERDVQGELGLDWLEVQSQRDIEVRLRLERAKKISAEYGLQLLTAYALLARPPVNATAAEKPPAEPVAPTP
jgi:capsid protein